MVNYRAIVRLQEQREKYTRLLCASILCWNVKFILIYYYTVDV